MNVQCAQDLGKSTGNRTKQHRACLQEHKTLETKHKDISTKASELEEQLSAATEAKEAVDEAHDALSQDHVKLQADADAALDAAAAIEKELEEERTLAADLKVRTPHPSAAVSLHSNLCPRPREIHTKRKNCSI